MDTAEARAVLAVGRTAGTEEIRRAFRRQLRRTHPDVARDVADAGRRTARLVQAYATLRRPPGAPSAPAPPPPAGRLPAITVAGDSLRWAVPAGEAFRLLVEVADSIGDITYVDVDAGLLDMVVVLGDGTACSLMATVAARPGPARPPDTEVLFALEPLGAGARPPAQPVVAAVASRLARAAPHQSNSGKPQARRPT
ncbi:MAG: DnaJ domain-containing protein [Actinomycetota bacterium]|nr:DnaJ domain-containing protein [Actinomycetota bacterium]